MIDLYSRSESLLTRSPGSNNEVEVALSTSPGWRAREAGPSCSLPNIWKPCSYAGCSKVEPGGPFPFSAGISGAQ